MIERIVNDQPPNFQLIVERFGLHAVKSAFFCYGNTIYNPTRAKLTPALLAHEGVHSERQGSDPAKWWVDYLIDDDFRYFEELLAHRVEYVAATEGVGRDMRRRYLAAIAERLSSPMYGRVTSKAKAKLAIMNGHTDPKAGPAWPIA